MRRAPSAPSSARAFRRGSPPRTLLGRQPPRRGGGSAASAGARQLGLPPSRALLLAGAALLRQPGGFEGFGRLTREGLEAKQLAAPGSRKGSRLVDRTRRRSACRGDGYGPALRRSRLRRANPRLPSSTRRTARQSRERSDGRLLGRVRDAPRSRLTSTMSGWISSSGNVRSPAFHRRNTLWANSTFSCDIAYSDSPAASRAAVRSGYIFIRSMRPSRNVQTCARRNSTGGPPCPAVPRWREIATT